jgi:hypothetical protein
MRWNFMPAASTSFCSAGDEVALEIDDRLHAERRKIGVVSAVRLGSAEVGGVDLAKLSMLIRVRDALATVDVALSAAGRADDWRQRERRGECERQQSSLMAHETPSIVLS